MAEVLTPPQRDVPPRNPRAATLSQRLAAGVAKQSPVRPLPPAFVAPPPAEPSKMTRQHWAIALSGILVSLPPEARPDLAALGLAFVMVGTLGLSIGTLNCFLLFFFPIWQRLWAIFNRPLFIVSCIFFTFESVPDKFQTFLWWNPIVHVVGQVRRAFYPYYSGDYVSPAFVFGIAMTLTVFGLVFLRRYHRDLIEAA